MEFSYDIILFHIRMCVFLLIKIASSPDHVPPWRSGTSIAELTRVFFLLLRETNTRFHMLVTLVFVISGLPTEETSKAVDGPATQDRRRRLMLAEVARNVAADVLLAY